MSQKSQTDFMNDFFDGLQPDSDGLVVDAMHQEMLAQQAAQVAAAAAQAAAQAQAQADGESKTATQSPKKV